MPFSTNSLLPSAWPIEDLGLELVASLFRCDAAEASRRLATLAKQQRDPTWLDATIGELPIPALCVASVLAGRGGMLQTPELEAAAKTTFGLSRADVDGAIEALLAKLLVAPLMSPRGSLVALVAPAADRLAERLVGLQLVPIAGTFTPDPEHDGGRAIVAVVAALMRFDLRLTQTGTPNRTALKKLAKQLGIEMFLLELLVVTSIEAGLTHVDEDGLIVVDREQLLAATEGRYPTIRALGQLGRVMAHGAAIAPDAIELFFHAGSYRRHGAVPPPVGVLGRLPGFCAGTVGATQAITYVAPTGAAAASVTPSFEVMLPPESHLREIVRVLELCEIVRIDRAIVARITKLSVTHAVGRGLTADVMIEALTSASRTPIPQNVTTAIRDWAGSTIVATVVRGTVIAVAPSEEARVRTAFASARPRTVAPGVIVVEEISEREVAATLRKLGILDTSPAKLATEQPARPTTSPVPIDESLPARLAAYRRGDPRETRLLVPARPRPAPPSRIDVQHREHEVVAGRLERWESETSSLLSLDLFDSVVEILAALSMHDRSFVFGARSETDLVARIGQVIARPEILRTMPSGALATLADELGVTIGGAAFPDRTSLQWEFEHIVPRLEAAARTHSTLALDLGTQIRTIAVSKLSRRGDALIVLGEDAQDISHAIRVAEIRAVAEARVDEAPSQMWRPAPGMTPPAGHAKCPCGSTKRYRDCCRNAMS
ncbi:MAG: helicase-associated domain-containing protein [Kofleriaceae bacterium]